MRLGLSPQHSEGGRLLCSPKLPQEPRDTPASGKGNPGHRTLCPLLPHPAIPAAIPQFSGSLALANSQILGSPSSGQEGAEGSAHTVPELCPAQARTERAVPVLGQLDLSDLLQLPGGSGPHDYYPPHIQVNKYTLQESLGRWEQPQHRMKGAARSDLPKIT